MLMLRQVWGGVAELALLSWQTSASELKTRAWGGSEGRETFAYESMSCQGENPRNPCNIIVMLRAWLSIHARDSSHAGEDCGLPTFGHLAPNTRDRRSRSAQALTTRILVNRHCCRRGISLVTSPGAEVSVPKDPLLVGGD